MILKFESFDNRREFLEAVERVRPEIATRLEPASILPDVVTLALSGEQESWLRLHRGSGRVFEDVQLEPFPGAA